MREIVFAGRAALGRRMVVVDIAGARGKTARRESAPLIPRPEMSLQLIARSISVDGEQRSADRMGQDPIPSDRRPGDSARGLGVDRAATVELGRWQVCVRSARVHQRHDRHGHFHACADGTEERILRVVPGRCAREHEICEQISAQLIDRAVDDGLVGRIEGGEVGGAVGCSASIRRLPLLRGTGVLFAHVVRHLRQAVVHAMDERRRSLYAQLGHAVIQVVHPDASVVARVAMTLRQRPCLELLGDPARMATQAVRRLGLCDHEDRGRVCRAIVGIIKMCARLDDDPRVRGRDAPGTLRRPHVGQIRHEAGCRGHPTFDRAIAHALCGTDLGGHCARRHVAVVRVVRLPGDVDRQPRRQREHAVSGSQHPADGLFRSLQPGDQIGEHRHLRVVRKEQVGHEHSPLPTTDIRRWFR